MWSKEKKKKKQIIGRLFAITFTRLIRIHIMQFPTHNRAHRIYCDGISIAIESKSATKKKKLFVCHLAVNFMTQTTTN